MLWFLEMWAEYDEWTLHTDLYEHLLRTTAVLAPTLVKLQDNLLDGKNMKNWNRLHLERKHFIKRKDVEYLEILKSVFKLEFAHFM